MNYKFSANALNIHQDGSLLIYIPGVLLAVLALLFFFVFPEPLPAMAHMLAGAALILLGLGAGLSKTKTFLRFSINSSRGVIEITNKTAGRESVADYPLSLFKKIVVRKNLSQNTEKAILPSFNVLLENDGFSSLLIRNLKEEQEALNFAVEFQARVMLDIYNNEELYRKPDFNLKDTNSPEDIQLDSESLLTYKQEENAVSISWKKPLKRSWLAGTVLILYGVFHLVHFALIPGYGLNIITGYIPGGILCFLWLLPGITSSRYTLRLDRENLVYCHSCGPVRRNTTSLLWDDVSSLQNSIEIKNASLIVFSNSGTELLDDLGEAPMEEDELEEMVRGASMEQLKIEISPLSLSDRIRLEQEINNFML